MYITHVCILYKLLHVCVYAAYCISKVVHPVGTVSPFSQ